MGGYTSHSGQMAPVHLVLYPSLPIRKTLLLCNLNVHAVVLSIPGEIQTFIIVPLWWVPQSPLKEALSQPSHARVRGSGIGNTTHLFWQMRKLTSRRTRGFIRIMYLREKPRIEPRCSDPRTSLPPTATRRGLALSWASMLISQPLPSVTPWCYFLSLIYPLQYL